MFNITLESKYQLNVNSGSNGCQVKYLKDNMWYKEDKSSIGNGNQETLKSYIKNQGSKNQGK